MPRRIATVVTTLVLAVSLASASDDTPELAWLLRIPDSVTTVLVADTSAATLYEYRFEAGRQVGESREHYMSIGQNGIRKERAGDRRTPLGVYFITEQLDTTRLHEKYGVMAFPLDYPNTLDLIAGRTGDGIWLHGVPPGPDRRPERDTDGCIAIPNENLAELATRLGLLETPVIVATEMQYADPLQLKAAEEALAAGVDAWGRSQTDGNLIDYLSLYADEFQYRGLSRNEWAAFRTEQFLGAETAAVVTRQLLVLKDPTHESLFVTRFVVQRNDGEGGTSTSRKRLYWQLEADGHYRIVAEDNG